ncbi:hypothetical protein BDP55DRAFT_662770 [Colletotrichum godetiae]|uniref:Uncharacterized protein n=1 Tax=Colletotrichum godetiae TaxID=1209918 RepID=A0AAJ0EY92_9PEZI|nr:uncharacterized protein BDP55DRAFT_662770 [Colletotrichum godetiae]KAK1675939.1 hypothetical protein BDP55DRAFT_662770 [Colletotrichum godetiae]
MAGIRHLIRGLGIPPQPGKSKACPVVSNATCRGHLGGAQRAETGGVLGARPPPGTRHLASSLRSSIQDGPARADGRDGSAIGRAGRDSERGEER